MSVLKQKSGQLEFPKRNPNRIQTKQESNSFLLLALLFFFRLFFFFPFFFFPFFCRSFFFFFFPKVGARKRARPGLLRDENRGASWLAAQGRVQIGFGRFW